MMQKHKFNYKWTLKDAIFSKDKGNVFSCFACGGGSSMGYKLAGFDVIGCNEIDHRMMYARNNSESNLSTCGMTSCCFNNFICGKNINKKIKDYE